MGNCALHRVGLQLAFMSLAVLLLSGARYQGQDQSSLQQILAQNVGSYEDGVSQIPLLFGHLSERYGFPLGLEIDGELADRHTSVEISRGTVADVLTAIVNQMPGYEWVIANGVVNVKPRKSADSILEVEVAHFQMRGVRLDAVAQAVTSITEVSAWLQRNGAVERHVISNYPFGDINNLPRISLDLRGRTLREILNAIVVKPRMKCWSVTRYGGGGKYVGIVVE